MSSKLKPPAAHSTRPHNVHYATLVYDTANELHFWNFERKHTSTLTLRRLGTDESFRNHFGREIRTARVKGFVCSLLCRGNSLSSRFLRGWWCSQQIGRLARIDPVLPPNASGLLRKIILISLYVSAGLENPPYISACLRFPRGRDYLAILHGNYTLAKLAFVSHALSGNKFLIRA